METCWYIAEIVIEHIIEGDPRNVVHINARLINTGSPEEVYDRAIALGREYEDTYVNTDDRRVRVQFHGLRHLDVLHDGLEDGAEIYYDEHIGVSAEEIADNVLPREALNVFAPRKGWPNDKPNYADREIVGPLLEAMGEAQAEDEVNPPSRPSRGER